MALLQKVEGITYELFQEIKSAFGPIAQRCSSCHTLITDTGSAFTRSLQEQISIPVRKFAFCQETEPYSDITLKTLKAVERILFANLRLAKAPKEIGIGYHPIFADFLHLLELRKEKDSARAALLQKLSLEEKGQKLIFFLKPDLPSDFLKELDPSLYIVFCPNEKDASEKKIACIPTYPFEGSTEQALQVADVLLYTQLPALGLSAYLAGVRLIHLKSAEELPLLTRLHLCRSVDSAKELAASLLAFHPVPHIQQREILFQELGADPDWREKICASITKLDI
jgi:hypothetical protein